MDNFHDHTEINQILESVDSVRIGEMIEDWNALETKVLSEESIHPDADEFVMEYGEDVSNAFRVALENYWRKEVVQENIISTTYQINALKERNARLVEALEKVYAERNAIEHQAFGMSDLFDDIKQALEENKDQS